MAKVPKVLLSAYQCGPGMGSVSQIGWHWYSRLAAEVPVTLVTHVRNRQALAAARAPLPNTDLIYVDTEWFVGPLYRGMSRLFRRSQHAVFLFSSLDYFVYDRTALRILAARQNHGAHWDLVHVPTPVSPVAATLLHRIGAPLVLGPWNGGLTSPKNFPDFMRADSAWLYPLRNFGRLINAMYGTTRKAAAILIANRSTLEAVPAHDRSRCRMMIENAVDPGVFSPAPYPAPPSGHDPLRIVFVGRLVPFKGVPMLIEAVDCFRQVHPLELVLVGAGPLEAELRREVSARGLDGLVRFTGDLQPVQVAATIAESHLFCLPSVRESGGAVLLEAMACARPVVAIAYGGPAELVDDEIGRAIPAEGRDRVVRELIAVFEDLVQSPGDWEARGLRGRQRVLERYTWSAKIHQALELYGELVPS